MYIFSLTGSFLPPSLASALVNRIPGQPRHDTSRKLKDLKNDPCTSRHKLSLSVAGASWINVW